MRVAHAADVHLGRRQYGYSDRADDASASFRWFLNEATDPSDGTAPADAIVVPGDLFDSRDIRPATLESAEEALGDTSQPVFVSPGNHDENMSRRRTQTWLEYLNDRGLITLLSADLDDGPLVFHRTDPDDPRQGGGGFADLHVDDEHVRLFGFQYRGAYTADELPAVADGIEAVEAEHGPADTTVLLAHFGVEDAVPDLGPNVTRADLRPLEGLVDRLLLGHIHKRYESADFAYNPGSLEAFDVREGRWDGHGYYRHDTATGETTHRLSKRRPYHDFNFDVTGYDSFADLRAAFVDRLDEEQTAAERLCDREVFQMGDGSRREPIVNVRFEGTLELAHGAFDVDKLEQLTAERLNAFHVQPTNGTERVAVRELLGELDREEAFTETGAVDTDALRERVFQAIAEESPYDEASDSVAETLTETEQLVTEDNAGTAAVAEFLQERRRELFPENGDDESERNSATTDKITTEGSE